MVLTATATAQLRVADVSYTFRDSKNVTAFRLGEECFVPISDLAAFGWNAKPEGDKIQIEAEGRHLEIKPRTLSQKACIPLRKAVEQLGMSASWVTATDRLEIFSEAKQIAFRDGSLEAKFPGQVKVTPFVLASPSRAVVDIEGARLTDSTRLDLDGNARAIQWKPNIIRVYTETPFTPIAPSGEVKPTDRVELAFSKMPEPTQPDEPPAPTTNPDVPTNVVMPIGSDTTPPSELGNLPLAVDIEGPSATLLSIRTGATIAPTYAKTSPTTLEITLPGLQMTLPDGFTLNTPSVVSATTRIQSGATVLLLELPRPMGVEVWSDANGVQIQLLKPEVGNGRLAGKVIVVDPGHGGHDAGAHAGGVQEKDLTLAIGRLLSAELSAQGATVIMTRRTDVFIPLPERCAIANRNRADFFISCHINSSKRASMSGTIIFHHKGKSMGQLLAECVMGEVAKVSKLPAKGAWSDGKIYDSGFAVLRGTKMPGVLCEFGFINQPTDRSRMVTSDFQRAVAAAVMRGIKVYLGDAKSK